MVVQAFKRSPIDFRPLFGVRPRRIAKGIGLFASAYALLEESGWPGPARERGLSLLEWLSEHRRLSSDRRAWSYEFDVQTRWAFYPAGTPNVIVTTFVGNAYLDWYERTGEHGLLSVAGQAAAWIVDRLSVRDEGRLYFSYVPGVPTLVNNANALAAGFLARYGRLAGDAAALGAAREAVATVVGTQRADGLWPYGEGSSLEWVDGFHTAYVLCGLLDVWEATQEQDVFAALDKGTRAYASKLFHGGTPRFGDRREFPRDVHCASSAIDYFARAHVFDGRYGDQAWGVGAWAIGALYQPSGKFAYQRTRWYLNRISYIRWSDAHALRALARLLATSS